MESATPDKPRFVAGSVGPPNVTLSLSPQVDDPAFRAVHFAEVRGGLRGADRRRSRRRGRPPAGRDDLRHAEREGGHRRRRASSRRSSRSGSRSRRSTGAGESLGSDLDAFWISVEHAEPSVGVNCSLGATRCGPSWSAREHRVDVRLLPPERRPAERVRPLRRAGRDDEQAPPRVRRGRPRERRRRLLRDDARAHHTHRARRRRPAAAPCSRRRARPRFTGLEPFDHRPGHPSSSSASART